LQHAGAPLSIERDPEPFRVFRVGTGQSGTIWEVSPAQ
jgi:hypothetical protein